MEAPPCFARRKKTAAERRAQRHRSEARFLQRALIGLNDVHAHRGGTLTRSGWALRESLLRLSGDSGLPPSPTFLPSVPDLSPHIDADALPAEEPVVFAHNSDDSAEPHALSCLAVSENSEGDDEATYMPIQFQEPSSSVHVSAVQFSSGSGDEPDVVLPQQLVGEDVSEAVSVPLCGPAGEVAYPQCFLVLADVRNCGTASKFALVTVQPFFCYD